MNQSTQTPPTIGTYWPNQGGYYAGIMRDAQTNQQWHLILVDHPEIKGSWGEYGNLIEGDFSRIDGAANTALILQHEPDNQLANAITQISADGHTDCYWPAQYENNLICANLPDQVKPVWHWSSTQNVAQSAWVQDFGDGYQSLDGKDDGFAVRAVRRLPI